MRDFLRRGFVLVFLGVLFSSIFLGCGEDDGPVPLGEAETLQELCEAACENIYEQCDSFLLHSNGSAVSQRVCRERCEEDSEFRGEERCVAQAECTDNVEDMVKECLPEGSQVGHCSHLGLWSRSMEEMEEEVVVLVNEVRAEGATCGGTPYGAAPPVTMNEELRCAARLHSVDMIDRDFFEHDNPDGETPFARIAAAGYGGGSPQGENIALGQRSAEAVMDAWMNSPGHCTNIMEPGFREIGMGLHEWAWTQKFGGGN